MLAAPWRSLRRVSIPGSPRRLSRSLARAAKVRSRLSRGKSGSRSAFRAASLGTIGLVAPSGEVYGSLTTPDPISLHKTLDELTREAVSHLAFEASSHGLDQRRLDGVRLAAGAFTNLSRDHLDYHPDMESYLAAKLRLFDTLLQPGQAAV